MYVLRYTRRKQANGGEANEGVRGMAVDSWYCISRRQPRTPLLTIPDIFQYFPVLYRGYALNANLLRQPKNAHAGVLGIIGDDYVDSEHRKTENKIKK